MDRKVVLFALVAVVGVVMLVAASAVTVFALVSDAPVQTEEVHLDQAPEIVPVQAESVSQPEVVEPVLKYEKASYSDHVGGCRYGASKLQLTQAPAEKLDEQPLAQVELE